MTFLAAKLSHIIDEAEAFVCEGCDDWKEDDEAHEIKKGFVCNECLKSVDRCHYCKEKFLPDDLAVVELGNGLTSLCCNECDPDEKQEFENKDFQ